MTVAEWQDLIIRWANACAQLGMDPSETDLELFGQDGYITKAELRYGENRDRKHIVLYLESQTRSE